MNLIQRSPLLRKTSQLPLRLLRIVVSLLSRENDYLMHPPILVNSFPKSGTHLLLQVVQGLPGVKTYGAFLASKPSITFRERSVESQIGKLRSMVPGEALPAHLFHDPRFLATLAELNVLPLIIYRDPRDVVVSEAIYLAQMNRWHRMHGHFARLESLEDRISTAILGVREKDFHLDYPDIAARFSRYAGWLSEPAVHPVRFEDLIGEGRTGAILAIARSYRKITAVDFDLERNAAAMEAAIDPERSHTFRKGRTGGWREVFSTRNKAEMKRVAGALLIELGYEQDVDW